MGGATASSIFTLVTSGLIGQGMGPALVGLLSDALEPRYGEDALRFALCAAISVLVWGALHAALGARSLRQDLPGELHAHG